MTPSVDSVLINVPLSSPLHPQANLPFIKGFIKQNGFKIRSFDTNIVFFRWLLADSDYDIKDPVYMQNPVALLCLYNQIEEALAQKCKRYPDLSVDLRTIRTRHDRLRFEGVLSALDDHEGNPFIDFYDAFVTKTLKPLNPKLVGISISFQDQIIAGFTLADRIRRHMPDVTLVFGGQMITRCYDNMVASGVLDRLWDYLICWDGELPLLALHQKLLREKDVPLTNVLEKGALLSSLDRNDAAFDLDVLDSPDFEDLNFEDYLFPDFLIPLQTARGCYGNCEFCAIPYGSNNSFRERTASKIVEDIRRVQAHTKARYGRKAIYFKFMDDTSSPRTLKNLAKEIISSGLEVKWETYVRMEKQFEDPAFMDLLYQGGCRKLMWGLETTDPDILKSMDKRISPVSTSKVLDAAHAAGILNFVFVLLGFPGETSLHRERLADFIISKESIHVLTVATFDVTKKSRIHMNFKTPNRFGIDCEPAQGFEVRLPYTIDGQNWKQQIVHEAQQFMVEIMKARPDIGLMSLCPDQIRSAMTDIHGNQWGSKFSREFGEDNIRSLLLTTERYIDAFKDGDEMELAGLPDPIKREHHRTMEDIKAIAKAIKRRKNYENRRMDSI